jgi:peptidoglycan hydrolase-like protein with peptidoglycan-binding domain
MWRAVSRGIGHLAGFVPNNGIAYVGLHARGDLVVWAQQHLVGAGYHVPVDGSFGTTTQQAVKRFQRAKGISTTGIVGTKTWNALLKYAPSRVHWGRDTKAASDAGGSGLPVSASDPPKANELHGAPGRGHQLR